MVSSSVRCAIRVPDECALERIQANYHRQNQKADTPRAHTPTETWVH